MGDTDGHGRWPGEVRSAEKGVRTRGSRWAGPAALGLCLLAMATLASVPWFDHLLRRAGRGDLSLARSDWAAYAVAVASAAVVGAVVAGRRPGHPVGWILLTLALGLALSGAATAYASYGLFARPGAVPGAAYVAVYPAAQSIYVMATCVGFVLLLTPTGHLPSPRWRPWARVAAAAAIMGALAQTLVPFEEPYRSVVNPFAVGGLEDLISSVGFAAFVVVGLQIPVAAWSVVARFRGSRGVERLQLGWLAFAAAAVGAAVVGMGVLLAAGVRDPDVLGWIAASCLAILPLAIGASVLRYRLYDVDRLVNRTLVYAVLTAFLGGAYAVIVAGASLLVRGSGFVTAMATLVVAALFRPFRSRVQAFIDRRFYRRRYDAARTLQEFASRLRDEVDLDRMRLDLEAVVRTTMEPSRAFLWLRDR